MRQIRPFDLATSKTRTWTLKNLDPEKHGTNRGLKNILLDLLESYVL